MGNLFSRDTGTEAKGSLARNESNRGVMNFLPLDNINIADISPLSTPRKIKAAIPQTEHSMQVIACARETLRNLLDRKDPRRMVIVGPCSIHNMETAREYAGRLKALATDVTETLVVVMRVYFEKPRSSIGWKGLINDPHLNDTFNIEEGIRMARRLLLHVAELELPAATELLDTLIPQYISDLISWSVIGARTAEAQTHREIASGISTPVGFKNGTDGSFDAAINGMRSSMGAHHFLGVTEDGLPAMFSTTGNAYPQMVLRGGKHPNYEAAQIALCEEALKQAHLPQNIVIDCSHGNSGKDPARQAVVLRDVLSQIENGNQSICGFMLESNLEWGSQPMPESASRLNPRQSITDACIDWETTEQLLREAHSRLLPFPRRKGIP